MSTKEDQKIDEKVEVENKDDVEDRLNNSTYNQQEQPENGSGSKSIENGNKALQDKEAEESSKVGNDNETNDEKDLDNGSQEVTSQKNGSSAETTECKIEEDKAISEIVEEPKPEKVKRKAEKDLNHENWNEEDEPEEMGEFKKASDTQLKDRKILTAKRKSTTQSKPSNPFSAFSFGSGPSN